MGPVVRACSAAVTAKPRGWTGITLEWVTTTHDGPNRIKRQTGDEDV